MQVRSSNTHFTLLCVHLAFISPTADRRDDGKPVLPFNECAAKSLSVSKMNMCAIQWIKPFVHSVFILERLSDEDVRKIVTQAVERMSETDASVGPSHFALPTPSPNDLHVDDDAASDVASSQPDIEEPLTHPTLTQDSTVSAGQLHAPEPHVDFPDYPQLTSKVLSSIVALSCGDARTALSLLELVLAAPTSSDGTKLLAALRRSVATAYDRTGESHYDMISALHKCVRGSQGSAALYWLARMLTAGEDPLYVARRMIVCASEDIGLADNHALPLVCHTFQHLLIHLELTSTLLGDGDVPGMPGHRHAGVPHQPRTSRLVPLRGTQVDALIRSLQACGGSGQPRPVNSCSAPGPQCTDETDEGTGICTWLQV